MWTACETVDLPWADWAVTNLQLTHGTDRLANSYLPVRQSSTVGCPTESTFARTACTICTIVISHSLISNSSVDRLPRVIWYAAVTMTISSLHCNPLQLNPHNITCQYTRKNREIFQRFGTRKCTLQHVYQCTEVQNNGGQQTRQYLSASGPWRRIIGASARL